MKVVIQRVNKASVSINQFVKSEIGKGYLILLGICNEDSIEDVKWLVNKISQLRIFSDKKGIMNESIIQADGEALVVSQFTLYAKTKKGNRPSYIRSADSNKALNLYNNFIESLNELINKEVKSGEFGAQMQVSLNNDGPVTIIIDTKNKE